MSAPTVQDLREGIERLRVDVEELVRQSRAMQGLPPKVEDPAVIARIATLMKAGDRR